MKYPNLLSEGNIGKLTIRNRVVLPPMHVGMGNYDGTASEEITAYYEERARGGVGLIITEVTRVNNSHGYSSVRQLSMAGDRHIEPFRKMADRLHALDTKIFVQLHHPGVQGIGLMSLMGPVIEGTGRLCPGLYDVLPKVMGILKGVIDKGYITTESLMDFKLVPAAAGPSKVKCTRFNQRPRALRKREIKKLEKQFIAAAKRVQLAGGDGVELHGAHGYLIQQFFSSHTNRRNDEYGGSLDNRMRFAINIIDGIRRECGPDFPIVVRLSVDEFYRKIGMPHQGIELEEGVEIARRLEKAGIDGIDVSSGNYETVNYWCEPISFEPGWRKYLGEAVREAVSIPVIAASVIRTPEQAEKQIAEGSQDFAVVGRGQLADPQWCLKAMEGREGEITRCISCLRCMESLEDKAFLGQPLDCSVNPRLGRESETADLKKDGNGRVVAVIGAGPGGMKAAETCALRGFKTVIFEKSDSVGGQLKLAAAPPKKEKIGWCIEDMEGAARRSGVEFRLNSEPSIEELKALNPYAVIVATGAKPITLPIPGTDSNNVCTVNDVLDGSVEIKNRRVAVIGSGLTGLETAEKLGADGNRLLIVVMLEKIGPGVFFQNFEDVMEGLKEFKPEFVTSYMLVNVGDGEITLEHVRSGWRVKEKVDNVVLAVGVCSENNMVEKLKPYFKNFYTIGDAQRPGKIYKAVEDGFNAARDL